MFPVISAVSIPCLQPSVSHSYLEPLVRSDILQTKSAKLELVNTRAMIFFEISVGLHNLTQSLHPLRARLYLDLAG